MLILTAGHVIPFFLNYQLLTPFYLWGMYTMPAKPADTFTVYHITYNEGDSIIRPHTYRDLRRMMWTYTLPKYKIYQESGDTLPVSTRSSNLMTKLLSGMPHSQPIHVTHDQLMAYPAWLARYLGQETGQVIYRLNVRERQVIYNEKGRPQLVSDSPYLQYP